MKEFPLHRTAEEGDLEKMKHFIDMDNVDVTKGDSSNHTPLHLAARCGKFEVAEYLLKHHCQTTVHEPRKLHTDCKNYEGATAINLAAEYGHKGIVDLLLKFGARMYHSSGGRRYWRVLHFASKRGWTDTVQRIVESGYLYKGDLDLKTSVGKTSLMFATEEGHLKIVQLLIRAGAKVNLCDNNSWTALHFASKKGQPSIVENIVNCAECDLNAKNSCGNTPLHIACGMNNTEIVQLLLKAGADSNIRNNKDETAFMGLSLQEAAIVGEKGKWTALHTASKRGWKELVQQIIESGIDKANLDKKTPLGMTPLMLAVEEGHADVVQLLLQAGAQVNKCDDNSWTALHFASNRGEIQIVDNILETATECDLNVKNSCGNTPLHIAYNMYNMEVIHLLLKAGADSSIRNNKNETAVGTLMQDAANTRDLWRVKYLIDLGISVDTPGDGNCTPLHYAAKKGCFEIAELLVHNNCKINPKVCDGNTPVSLAAIEGHQDVVDYLLQCGAQVTYADDYHYTLLHWASHHGWMDLVLNIIQKGELDINVATCSGETPLIRAARRSEDVAAILIKAGAEVNLCDKQKGTALHFASGLGHIRTVQILLEKDGINLNPTDEDGNTPLHKACSSRQAGIVRMLLIAGAKTDIKNNRNETAFSIGIKLETLDIEEIRLFLLHGAFIEDCDYVRISRNPNLREHILEDVNICTSLIVNKFNNHSLPELYSNFEFANELPPIEDLKISCQQKQSITNCVESDIQSNTSCNVMTARPIVLTFMCVQSLLSHQSTMKRSASSAGSLPLKKPRLN